MGDLNNSDCLFSDYLEFIETLPIQDHMNLHAGFTASTIHAFQGRRDDAFKVLEVAIDAGYVHQWWSLREGAFDPDYAAVIDDPRFEELYGRIVKRVSEMREGYFSQPDLLEGWTR